MSTQGPDPRAGARGLLALALDMARVDPDRRPSTDMRQWLVDMAITLGQAPPPPPRTNKEFVVAALRLEALAHEASEAPSSPPQRPLAGLME